MRFAVTAAICAVCRRTSSYVMRLNGPISPGRWHGAQRVQTIGAMSFANVSRGWACAGARCIKNRSTGKYDVRSLKFDCLVLRTSDFRLSPHLPRFLLPHMLG